MVVELEAFNDLVKLYETNILSGSYMDKDDVFDEEYGKSPIFELTAEDRNNFTTGYEERVSDFKQSIAEHQHLLSGKQRMLDTEAPSETVDELSQAIFQNEENIEGLINELIGYRDVLGYDAERERESFGLDEDLFPDNYPPSFKDISTFVFEDLYKPKDAIDINEQWVSGFSHVPENNSVSDSGDRVSSFEAIALTMFDALDDSEDYANESSNDINDRLEAETPAIAIGRDNLEEQRDIQLALDCREILQAQGQDIGKVVIFERPDGNGLYRFSLEKESDTMTLGAKDRPEAPILIESQGKIIESQVTSRDAAQIGKAASMLIEQSKSAEIIR